MWIDDNVLCRKSEAMALEFWIPKRPMVVLGSSNHENLEVNVEQCLLENVPILKRYGGGGTVLLHSGCVVVSIGIWVQNIYQNQLYFNLLNSAIIDCLSEINPLFSQLSQRGLSDICHQAKKVAGTSLFRSRNYLLYQASLLIESRINDINRYLKHPSREPDYRARRPHESFLMGLNELVPDITPEICHFHIKEHLEPKVLRHLSADLISPVQEQFPAIEARIQRAKSVI